MSAPDRIRIERELGEELDAALASFSDAKTELRRALEETSHPSTSDGLLRLNLANTRHIQAVDDYRIALGRFTDFVIKRIVPPSYE